MNSTIVKSETKIKNFNWKSLIQKQKSRNCYVNSEIVDSETEIESLEWPFSATVVIENQDGHVPSVDVRLIVRCPDTTAVAGVDLEIGE